MFSLSLDPGPSDGFKAEILGSPYLLKFILRESSFNMTRGGDEDIEGGLRKFLDTQRGGL